MDSADPGDQVPGMTRITTSLDNGRVSFGDREEVELANATDPVCGREIRRADAHSAVDHHGVVYFFHTADCRAAFDADPDRYAAQAAERLVDSAAP
jgi:YHS domain-containing protein